MQIGLLYFFCLAYLPNVLICPYYLREKYVGNIVHLRLTFSYVFKVLVMKELTLESKILIFSMEFNDLLRGNLDLAILSLSFFDISMLLYMGKMQNWQDFAILGQISGQLKNYFLP